MIPEPEKKYASKWRELAYTPEELKKLESLPVDLRNALFPYDVSFGPASDEIGAFISAYDKLHQELSPEEWSKLNRRLRSLSYGNNSFPYYYNKAVKSSEEHDLLGTRFYKGFYLVAGNRYLYNDSSGPLVLICWLMTARFLFDDQTVRHSQFLVEPVNKILTEMELPPLIWGRRNKEQS